MKHLEFQLFLKTFVVLIMCYESLPFVAACPHRAHKDSCSFVPMGQSGIPLARGLLPVPTWLLNQQVVINLSLLFAIHKCFLPTSCIVTNRLVPTRP